MSTNEARHLWVSGLPNTSNEEKLKQHYEKYGKVNNVKFIWPSATELNAIVTFGDVKSAVKARSQENVFEGVRLTSVFYDPMAIINVKPNPPLAKSENISPRSESRKPSDSGHRGRTHSRSSTSSNSDSSGPRKPTKRSYSSSSSTSSSSSSDSTLSDRSDRNRAPRPKRGKQPFGILVKNLPVKPNLKGAAALQYEELKKNLFTLFKRFGHITSIIIEFDGGETQAVVTFRRYQSSRQVMDTAEEIQYHGCTLSLAMHAGYETDNQADYRPPSGDLSPFHAKATRTLFVGNLPLSISPDDLKKLFMQFGDIVVSFVFTFLILVMFFFRISK